MAGFQEEHLPTIIEACRSNAGTLAEGLDRCFDEKFALHVESPLSIDVESLPDVFDGPGLALVIQVEEQSLLGLIPASFPLPDWYTEPDESQASRLQTLAMEWSFALLPEDLDPESYAAVAVSNLRAALGQSDPAEWGQMVAFAISRDGEPDASSAEASEGEQPAAEADAPVETVSAESDSDADETPEEASAESETDPESEPASESESAGEAAESDDATEAAAEETSDEPSASNGDAETTSSISNSGSQILFLGPVNNPPVAEESTGNDEPVDAKPAVHATQPPVNSPEMQRRQKNLRHISNLEVKVVVRLAEKKIEMGQLLSIAPGALITFNKQCEELLDLYVNNQLYCRGEAVKIGEKFGLKVNEVGSKKVREKQILFS